MIKTWGGVKLINVKERLTVKSVWNDQSFSVFYGLALSNCIFWDHYIMKHLLFETE